MTTNKCTRTKQLQAIEKLKTFGERSFGYIAPTVWNSLPADLRASPSLPTFKANRVGTGRDGSIGK